MTFKKSIIMLSAVVIVLFIFFLNLGTNQNDTKKDNLVTDAVQFSSVANPDDIIKNEQEYDNALSFSYDNVQFDADEVPKDLDNEINPSVPISNLPNISSNSQSYRFASDFPYNRDMPFADEDIFRIIKEAYNKIDFYGEFDKGNIEVYDYYRQKFFQLIKNQMPFFEIITGEKFYLTDFGEINKYYTYHGRCDFSDYTYLFFDMDKNGTPDLCITDGMRFHYIFKYDIDTDKFILLYDMSSSYYSLIGSGIINWNKLGDEFIFNKVNNGEQEYAVSFFQKNIINGNEQLEAIYMMALPLYKDKNKQENIAENLKKQAYFEEISQRYYFRVTEMQYEELTNNYFESVELAKENIKEVTYEYEELFGDF